ncbi:STAS domain-containing protein [Desulfospira joergensenii]|uniref:STAS domain-containing protein n=1 Tax=Desulfospira joergensenii TaxID=53329 RepID=UPI0003B45611|nr:STAS domain-containing protein [Desulfospira joergensenii]
MDIKVEDKDHVTLVDISGRLDASTASKLEAALDQVAENPPGQTVISLQELIYISSAGLRVLLSFAKKLQPKGAGLSFAGLEGSVKGVFEISGFYSLFKVYPTVDEAVSAAG